jgi:hypothetical protein
MNSFRRVADSRSESEPNTDSRSESAILRGISLRPRFRRGSG